MIRWYVFPVQEVVQGETTYRGPKYLRWRFNEGGLDVPWNMMDYGLMPTALLVADVTPAQHALAASRPDIIIIPENIDQQIGSSALSAVTDALELLHIPSEWVTSSHTYRDVMRKVGHLFQFSQRYHGRTAMKLIDGGVTLDTKIIDLPTNVRVSLSETAQDLGYDVGPIQGGWTVRQALGYLADQWGSDPLYFGGLGVL